MEPVGPYRVSPTCVSYPHVAGIVQWYRCAVSVTKLCPKARWNLEKSLWPSRADLILVDIVHPAEIRTKQWPGPKASLKARWLQVAGRALRAERWMGLSCSCAMSLSVLLKVVA